MSGFGANSGELVAAASSIRGAADPVRDEHGERIAGLRIGGDAFGRVHGQAAGGYQEGMAKLARSVTSVADAMDDFSGKLEQTGHGYDWSDADAADTVGKSGNA
ncbi:WXG100 family type VII secretion target [Saccharopolyspora sp. MS10]|uniref:WXG100 family type VII secretion target n=1 Tax=Saccharopolyspora sp. MS10 TaxID=3385973 RepID=UPI0039A353DC